VWVETRLVEFTTVMMGGIFGIFTGIAEHFSYSLYIFLRSVKDVVKWHSTYQLVYIILGNTIPKRVMTLFNSDKAHINGLSYSLRAMQPTRFLGSRQLF